MQQKWNQLSWAMSCLQKRTLLPRDCSVNSKNVLGPSQTKDFCPFKNTVQCKAHLPSTESGRRRTARSKCCDLGCLQEQCQAVQHLTSFHCFAGKATVLSFAQAPQQQPLRLWPERKEEGYVVFNSLPVRQFACVW